MLCYASRRSTQGPKVFCWFSIQSLAVAAIQLGAILQYSGTPILRAAGSVGLRGLGSMVKYVGFLAFHSQAEPVEREVENRGGIES